eukprot:07282_1
MVSMMPRANAWRKQTTSERTSADTASEIITLDTRETPALPTPLTARDSNIMPNVVAIIESMPPSTVNPIQPMMPGRRPKESASGPATRLPTTLNAKYTVLAVCSSLQSPHAFAFIISGLQVTGPNANMPDTSQGIPQYNMLHFCLPHPPTCWSASSNVHLVSTCSSSNPTLPVPTHNVGRSPSPRRQRIRNVQSRFCRLV